MRQLFLNYVAQTSDSPLGLEIVGGEGIYLLDKAGKKYIDLICGIGPSILGHSYQPIVKAVQDQAAAFMHTLVYGEMILSPQVKLAELLVHQLPPSLNNVYFTSTGTEATEGAMKLAKRYTGRKEILSFQNAYHGSTQGALSLMSDAYFTVPFYPLLPEIKHLRFPDMEDLDLITTSTAAVFIETIRAESGIHRPSKAFLQALRQRCTEVGALLVLDEIQAAYGRTGYLFAFQAYDIVPDILLLGKGFGGGMPLAAFVADQSVMRVLSHDPVLGHITTYGGHPVSCAAGLATLEALLREDFISSVPSKEQIFLQRLKHPLIKEVRSAGLWLAVTFESWDQVKLLIKQCLHRGLITDWFLFNDTSIRICPPLNIASDEIHKACDILLESMDHVYQT
jgi:acetylornithine/N-succinyldiaminopimelate aminotransferase